MRTLAALGLILAQAPPDVEAVRDVEFGKGGERAIQENRAKVAQANPIPCVSKAAPPFLIMHGDQDDLVWLSQSEMLHEALKKAGVESTLQVVKGQGHGFRGGDPEEQVEAFFERVLKPRR
jgi:dipeptidyl aminopeptidase/acylaminoacyl peptidase